MTHEEFKKDIELKIKTVKKLLRTWAKKGTEQYEYQSGYLHACEEILEELKEVKQSISISPDLIMSAEELHKSSLMGPCGAQLAWNEIVEEDKKFCEEKINE